MTGDMPGTPSPSSCQSAAQVLRGREITSNSFDVGLALVAGLTAAMMVVHMTVLQTLDGGTPRYMALGAGVAMLRAGFGCLNFYVLLSFSATSTVTKGG